jgi:hypothetical protein
MTVMGRRYSRSFYKQSPTEIARDLDKKNLVRVVVTVSGTRFLYPASVWDSYSPDEREMRLYELHKANVQKNAQNRQFRKEVALIIPISRASSVSPPGDDKSDDCA